MRFLLKFATCIFIHIPIQHFMKTISEILLSLLILINLTACKFVHDAKSGATKSVSMNGNSLFHRMPERKMKTGSLQIEGEILGAGEIKLDGYYKREVITKEVVMTNDSILFIGAYRYKGYSLFDLINPYMLQKKNEAVFKPQIDAYIIVENDENDRVVFSWSEIFHTSNPHQVLLATEAAPIVPYRKEVDYPFSETWKMVAANDLYSHRNLVNPTRIIVRTFDSKEYTIDRNLKSMYSPTIELYIDSTYRVISARSDTFDKVKYLTTFYGMGMGYHPVDYFEGAPLQKFFPETMPFRVDFARDGLVCMVGIDGYRTIFSYSELFNRMDQVQPILSTRENNKDEGYFRIYLPSDFFSDRSVKSLKEIVFFQP